MRQFEARRKSDGDSTLKRLYRESFKSLEKRPGSSKARAGSPERERGAASPTRAESPTRAPASPSTPSTPSPSTPPPPRGALSESQASAVYQIKGMLGDLKQREVANKEFREAAVKKLEELKQAVDTARGGAKLDGGARARRSNRHGAAPRGAAAEEKDEEIPGSPPVDARPTSPPPSDHTSTSGVTEVWDINGTGGGGEQQRRDKEERSMMLMSDLSLGDLRGGS